jgi:hypothetical protein
MNKRLCRKLACLSLNKKAFLFTIPKWIDVCFTSNNLFDSSYIRACYQTFLSPLTFVPSGMKCTLHTYLRKSQALKLYIYRSGPLLDPTSSIIARCSNLLHCVFLSISIYSLPLMLRHLDSGFQFGKLFLPETCVGSSLQ